uniref:Succinate dehydrogenase complex assembly factor 4 n=1 Tax=Capra hircus TaxID=9925 RepID=A0A8C2R8H8_CAPHI
MRPANTSGKAVADAAGAEAMAALGLASLLGRVPTTAWRAARSPLLYNSLRKVSSQGGKPEPSKQPLKKPKLPEGRFDAPEDSSLEKEPLTSSLWKFRKHSIKKKTKIIHKTSVLTQPLMFFNNDLKQCFVRNVKTNKHSWIEKSDVKMERGK